MGYIQDKLELLEGKLISITRNTEMGYYELKIGLPPDWTYKANSKVDYEEEHKSEKGDILKIFPHEDSENTTIDDLINYVNIVIKTNLDMQKKKEEFEKRLLQEREKIEKEMEKFYEELESEQNTNFEMDDDDQPKSKSKKIKERVDEETTDSDDEDEDVLKKINS